MKTHLKVSCPASDHAIRSPPDFPHEHAGQAASSRNQARKWTVFLVDRQPIVRHGLRRVLETQPDLEICGEADNCVVALRQIENVRPDLAIVDIALNSGSGLNFIKNLKAVLPEIAVMVFSAQDESLYADFSLRAGALGYVRKDESPEAVIAAVRKVLAGQLHVHEAVAARLLRQHVNGYDAGSATPLARLSPREIEVFRMIGEWKGTRKIAGDLHLSVKSVEYYREQVKLKLQLTSGTDLLRAATEWLGKELNH